MTQSRFPLLLSLGLSPGVVFSTGQQSECAEGHTCFSLQVNLPMEPGGDREEFKRLSNTRYQVQEREVYYQLRMDQTVLATTSSGSVMPLCDGKPAL